MSREIRAWNGKTIIVPQNEAIYEELPIMEKDEVRLDLVEIFDIDEQFADFY